LLDGSKDYQRLQARRNQSFLATASIWCLTGASVLISGFYYDKYCDGRTVAEVKKYRSRTEFYNNIARGGLVIGIGFSGYSFYEFFHLIYLGNVLEVNK